MIRKYKISASTLIFALALLVWPPLRANAQSAQNPGMQCGGNAVGINIIVDDSQAMGSYVSAQGDTSFLKSFQALRDAIDKIQGASTQIYRLFEKPYQQCNVEIKDFANLEYIRNNRFFMGKKNKNDKNISPTDLTSIFSSEILNGGTTFLITNGIVDFDKKDYRDFYNAIIKWISNHEKVHNNLSAGFIGIMSPYSGVYVSKSGTSSKPRIKYVNDPPINRPFYIYWFSDKGDEARYIVGQLLERLNQNQAQYIFQAFLPHPYYKPESFNSNIFNSVEPALKKIESRNAAKNGYSPCVYDYHAEIRVRNDNKPVTVDMISDCYIEPRINAVFQYEGNPSLDWDISTNDKKLEASMTMESNSNGIFRILTPITISSRDVAFTLKAKQIYTTTNRLNPAIKDWSTDDDSQPNSKTLGINAISEIIVERVNDTLINRINNISSERTINFVHK